MHKARFTVMLFSRKLTFCAFVFRDLPDIRPHCLKMLPLIHQAVKSSVHDVFFNYLYQQNWLEKDAAIEHHVSPNFTLYLLFRACSLLLLKRQSLHRFLVYSGTVSRKPVSRVTVKLRRLSQP